MARNLVDPLDGFLRNAKYLVHDRDPLFNKAWSQLLANAGVSCVAIPAQSPNCNPYAERFVRTVREECLDQFVIFGEAHLRHLLAEFVQHYNRERYHQGKGGKLVMPNLLAVNDSGAVAAIKRLLTGFVASADTRTDHLVSSAREQSLAAGAGGSSTL